VRILENADEKGMLISFVTAIPILQDDAKRGEKHNARFVDLRSTTGRGVFECCKIVILLKACGNGKRSSCRPPNFLDAYA